MSRSKHDFYPTEDWLATIFLRELRGFEPTEVLEPAVGAGAISKAVRKRWPNARVTAFDLDPKEPGWTRKDFFKATPEPRFDLVITNPPFNQAMGFVRQAMEWRKSPDSMVAMLLRLGFLGSQERGFWLSEHTPGIYVTSKRPSFVEGGKTDNSEYAWFTWRETQPPLVHILPTW